jgi:hypothetical protein
MSDSDNSKYFCDLERYIKESKLLLTIETIDLWGVSPGGYGPIGV